MQSADTESGTELVGPLRVALVHDWLCTYAGSERVLEQLLACFPDATLFAVVDFVPPGQRHFLGGRPVRTSFIQRLPFARRWFRHYLGLMPLAIEQFDLSGFDLVISSSHAVAKGAVTGPDQLHISYVHSPMRYAWDMQGQYLRQAGLERGLRSWYARWLLSRLRQWDVRTAAGVDVFVANSAYIARRIRKAYRREADLISPPVDVARFALSEEKSDYYLVLSRQVPYKRVELIAEAFAGTPERKLVIAGDGPQDPKVLRAAAGRANITLLGAVEHAAIGSLMGRARALVIAAEEDFGITMVEAQACGTPVIAFGRGGALDIVRPPPSNRATGVLFHEQSVEAIRDAMAYFERIEGTISPRNCRVNALRFSEEEFRSRVLALVAASMGRFLPREVARSQDAGWVATDGRIALREPDEALAQ